MGVDVGKTETEAAVEEGAEREEHAVRKRVLEGTHGSDAGCKRKKQYPQERKQRCAPQPCAHAHLRRKKR